MQSKCTEYGFKKSRFVKEQEAKGLLSNLKIKTSFKAEPDHQLADEFQRQIIRKFEKRKVYSSFRDNIWGVDLADMQSLTKYNNRIRYLLCALDLLSIYVWVVLLKDKRGITILNAFQKIISKGCKPNKIWVDQGGEFYNNLFKRFLKNNNIEMY